MNKLINLAVKLSGLGWIWQKIDGYKTAGSVTLAVLTALLGLGNDLAPILAAHDAGALLAFIKTLPGNPSWKLIIEAGLALGLGHKVIKAIPSSSGGIILNPPK